MELAVSCPKCQQAVIQLNPGIVIAKIFTCFSCMIVAYPGAFVKRELVLLYALKRIAADDWRIGDHQQLTKNKVWEEELECLYTLWIGERMLDDLP